MTRAKWLVVSVLSAALLFGVTGCGSNSKDAKDASANAADEKQKVVKIALNSVPNPLYSFKDDKGEPAGYMIDYLHELEKNLPEYKFDYESVETDAQLVGTDSGKYDVAASFFFRNPEREAKYLFPQYNFGYSITALAVKSDRDDIKTLDDLVGKKLVPITPNSGLRYILKDYNLQHPGKEITIESIDKTSPADDLKLVASGQYDATYINVNQFEDVVKKLNLDLKVGGVISKEPVWFLYNKSQGELVKRIDEVTNKLVEDGTLSKLAEKWFNVDFFKSLDYVKQGYQFRKS